MSLRWMIFADLLRTPTRVTQICIHIRTQQPRFLYFFMALSASISGWQHCRSVISIDGTSLKNKYGGTLLSASTPDANDQIFPLAFCVVDSKIDSSWTWFCNQLKRIIGGRNEEPQVEVEENSGYRLSFIYNVMTTNIYESLNSAMLKARELPICSMLEVLRMMLQRWFFERRNDADYQVTDFTKTIVGLLREQIELSRSMKVNQVNNLKYQVINGTSQYVIYLPTKSHVSPLYLNSTLSSRYRPVINPLGDHCQWQIPDDIMSIVILPPNVKRAVGRPKKFKILSRIEFKRRVKCGRCGRVGHNR
ncbi:protein FAR1-RELATED SEQUENCE 3-like [Cucumis melo var. makuwa]|uniref:Protein FAR1-RELATED SEQUENCE 3-like n=1 Tax=Cucumis melo var. makuwa TaxID=1194695 RepID=A0A5D3C2C0_CUCMM|nr:protein FAR1-RELATED SEQUENCE 3-like [Cucumis melo var. makuwa]TYK04566.1 protein FAR1-RELATED SEQUENCE 3-like [Cucumis melo var. makuwa]